MIGRRRVPSSDRVRGRAWLALLVGAVLLAAPYAARAHGVLRRSVPASGAHLAAAPRELRLTFSERVELAVARVELLGPGDRAVALSPLRVGASPETIVADVAGPLVAGTYTVAWQIAGRDGHPVRGRFRFTIAPGATGLATALAAAAVTPDAPVADTGTHPTVGGDTAAVGHHDPTAMPGAAGAGAFDARSPLFAAARWLGFLGALALTGAVGYARTVVPRAARLAGGGGAAVRESAGGARALGMAAAAVLLLAALLRLAAQSVAMHGAAEALDPGLVATMVAGTGWGTGWLLQVAGGLAALAGLALARRGAAGWWVAAAAVVAVAVGAALSGHAAAVPDAAALAVASDAAHVLGAGGWLGTLLALVVVGVPAVLRRAGDGRGAAAAALVHAFSPVALACAGVVAATGVAAAWWHVGSVGALWTSAYGRLLLGKLAVVAVIAGVGAYNWRRVRPAMGDDAGARRVRRTAAVELALGVVVLAVTAVLVATPPPTDALH